MNILLRSESEIDFMYEIENKFNNLTIKPEKVYLFSFDKNVALLRRLCVTKGIPYEEVNNANELEYCKEVII